MNPKDFAYLNAPALAASAVENPDPFMQSVVSKDFKFSTHFHPYACEFIKRLAQYGIDGLLTLDTQTLGNAYLHSPWGFGYSLAENLLPAGATLVDFTDYAKVPHQNADFHALVTVGAELWHWSHNNSSVANPWKQAGKVTDNVTGPAALVKDRSTDELHALVLKADGLWHFSFDPKTSKLSGPPVRVSAASKASGSLIHSDFGHLEAVVLEGNKLVHYWRDTGGAWSSAGIVSQQATGPGALVQSSYRWGTHGNFEVLVTEGRRLIHYAKDNNKGIWWKVGVVTDSLWEPQTAALEGYALGPNSLIQGRIRDGWHGNYEVVVREGKVGSDLVHYWKDNSTPEGPWHRGNVVTNRAKSPGSIVHGPWGAIGNFEVMVAEPDRVAHYWHANEGERFYFHANYEPTANVLEPFPRHEVDFNCSGAHSKYNWEIFFHLPMLLATTLADNQRFDEATRWFHFVFDPTTDVKESETARYWKCLPFRDTERQRIDDFLRALNSEGLGSAKTKQVDAWRKNPFDPHLIAGMRPIAYQKHVVMKYLDHKIAKADQRFRDARSLEDINAATQDYVVAKNVLGPLPQRVPRRGKIAATTFEELSKIGLDAFSNVLVALENEAPFSSLGATPSAPDAARLLGMGHSLFFCTPRNDKLLAYWDTVSDRLFKLRHCLSIDGTPLDLPLFEPAIEPALLVQAAAKGLSISSVLADLGAPLPKYRFTYVLQKALELCSDVRAYGAALLSAIEKGEAEKIAVMRATHEAAMLKRIINVKDQQVKEAGVTRDAIEVSANAARIRSAFYRGCLDENGVGETGHEREQQHQLSMAQDWQSGAQFAEAAGAVLAALPIGQKLTFGTAGMSSPVVTTESGAQFLANAAQATGRVLGYIASVHSYWAAEAGTQATFERRKRDWQLQLDLANNEQKQIDKQTLAAQIREQIAQQDLDNQLKQLEESEEVKEFLQTKYTNAELYNWMRGETASVFFQSYRLAYEMAKQAERTFRFERGLATSDYIKYGYWDNLHSGFMAGDRLDLALKQMQKAYLDQNRRDYEISKDISLLRLDPLALITLKETGNCEFDLPELLFDTDYPGHFMRRIKAVSVTIPCVVGPYTSVNCTLTLLHSKIRKEATSAPKYAEQEDDNRFLTDFAAVQSIATSHAQNDAGMFELNFRDERYLPFEGAGAISRWRIDMPKDCNGFDFDSISDVIIKLNYTAREGGALLREGATLHRNDLLKAADTPQARLFSARHEFPNEWQRFLHPADETAAEQVFEITLDQDRFPFLFRGKQLQFKTLNVYKKFSDKRVKAGSAKTFAELYAAAASPPNVSAVVSDQGASSSGTITLKADKKILNGLGIGHLPLSNQASGTIKISVNQNQLSSLSNDLVLTNSSAQKRLVPAAVQDLLLLVEYIVI